MDYSEVQLSKYLQSYLLKGKKPVSVDYRRRELEGAGVDQSDGDAIEPIVSQLAGTNRK